MSSGLRRATVTQAEVATQAGCTQRSVLVAFGGSGRISQDLWERILSIAHDLGYRPHAGARELRLGRSRRVPLVQSANPISAWLPQQLLMGLEDGLAAHDRHLAVVRLADADLLADGALPRTLEALGAEGLLLNYDAAVPAGLPRLIERYGIPAVWLNSKHGESNVRPDDRHAGILLAEHLAALGHRRALWCDVTGWHAEIHYYSHDKRWEGYRDRGAELGLETILEAPRQMCSDYGYCDALVTALKRTAATAIATYSPLDASVAMVAVERVQRRVPEHCSVVTVNHD